MDVATFKTTFPEFASADDGLVSAKLAEALRSIDVDIWGDLAVDGQAYLAAHLLAMSPFGIQAGFRAGAGANQTSVYWGTYDEKRQRIGRSNRLVLP